MKKTTKKVTKKVTKKAPVRKAAAKTVTMTLAQAQTLQKNLTKPYKFLDTKIEVYTIVK